MRSRTLVVALLALAVLVVVPSTAWAQSDAEVKALSDKVDALERRITTMERNLTQQLSGISKQLASGAGAGPSAATEAEAKTALGVVNQLVASGDTIQAKEKMTTFMQKYGTTQAAQGARRTYQELQVIGKAIPADWGIEKWFQGESAVNLSGDKTTLLVFWETWCPHCQREIPVVKALIDDGAVPEGLEIVVVSTAVRDGDPNYPPQTWLEGEGWSGPIMRDSAEFDALFAFGAGGFPFTVYLDSEHRVVARSAGELPEDIIRQIWLATAES